MPERTLRSNADKINLLQILSTNKQEDSPSVQLSTTGESDHQLSNSTMDSNSLMSKPSITDLQMVMQMLQKMQVDANNGVQELKKEFTNRSDLESMKVKDLASKLEQGESRNSQEMKNIQDQIDAMKLAITTTPLVTDQSSANGNGCSIKPQAVESDFRSHMQSQNLLRMALDKQIDELKPYHGKKQENVDSWIKQIDKLTEIARMPEEEIFMLAKLKLQGDAEKWWDNKKKEIDSWKMLKSKLMDTFGPLGKTNKLELEALLHRRKQNLNEPATKYWNDMMCHCSAYDENMSTQDQVWRIFKGALPEFRYKYENKVFDNVDQLLKALIQHEENTLRTSYEEQRDQGQVSNLTRGSHNAIWNQQHFSEAVNQARTSTLQAPKLDRGPSKDGDDPKNANTKHPSLFYITTLVNQQPIKILVDTGAHKSFISNETIQHLGLQLVHGHDRSHWLADGITPFVTNGEVNLCVKLGEVETTVLASVAQTLSCSCILGVDWIRANNVSILTHENRIVMFNKKGNETASVAMERGRHNSKTNLAIGTLSIQSTSNVKQIIENLSTHLEDIPQQQQQVQNLLDNFKAVFDLSLPTKATPAMFHAIDTGQAQPIVEKPRIQSKFQKEETKKHVATMLAAGQIVHSNSPWAAPVHIVGKPDGTTRFTVDYRKLNEVTIKDNYPLPSISETINQLQGNCYYTKMDLKSGYLQIPILERDQPKTAFITREGLYHFKVLPAGLKNAPPTFQRIMNTIIGKGREHFCLIYVDDIMVFSKSFDDHLGHVRDVLAALHKHHFQLNPPKCEFFKAKINYLGHTIDASGMRPLNDKIETIKQLPMPTSLREANYFIGTLGFYRKFIEGFAQMAAPIHRITNLHKQQRRGFIWGPEQANAFQQLKLAISSKPLVLDFPDDVSPLILSTDASDIGIGGVLKQVTSDGMRVIYYHSQLLNAAQRRYATIEKEALAVFKCVDKLRPYLLGRDFIIETDHCPLCNFHKQGSKNRRVDTWSLILSEYNIQEVRYKKGKCNCDADLMSRYPLDPPDKEISVDRPMASIQNCLNVITRAAAARTKLGTSESHSSSTTLCKPTGFESNDRSFLKPDHNNSSTLPKPASCRLSPLDLTRIKEEQRKDGPIQQHLKQLRDDMIVSDGILYQKCDGRNGEHIVPYIPKSLVPEILAAAHDHQFSAHFGRDKTFEKLKSRCFWPSMYAAIQTYVKGCQDCARFNIRRRKPPGHLQPIEPPSEIFQMVGLDFWGPVQESNNGNKYILVLTDYLSKFVVAKALPTDTAQAAAEFIVETALTFGVPSQLLTDNGTHFKNKLFQCLSNILGFEHILSTPYHPQTNGQTERWNATMRPKLAMLSQDHQDNWDNFLAGVVHAYNTSVHATTGYSPSFLVFGREIPLAFDPARPILQLPNVSNYVEHLSRYRKVILKSANDNVRRQQHMAKQRHDRNRQAPVYEIGQLVFVKRHGNGSKFDERQSGPFRIIGKVGNNHLTYLIASDHTTGRYQVHVNDLSAC